MISNLIEEIQKHMTRVRSEIEQYSAQEKKIVCIRQPNPTQ
jgi:hypothetical protein